MDLSGVAGGGSRSADGADLWSRFKHACREERGAVVTGLAGVAASVVVVGLVAAALLLWLMVDSWTPEIPPGMEPRVVETRRLLDRVTTGSILLSRHVHARTRRRTLFNAMTAASDWYHVGLVVRRPGDRRLMVLDCMADGEVCELPCAGHRPLGEGGPRLVDAMHYMLVYSLNPGVCGFRVLDRAASAAGTGGAADAFDQLAWRACIETTRYPFVHAHEFLPKLVEGAAERALGRRVGRRGRVARMGSGVFCSEIVALILMELGVLDHEIGAGAFTPWSFCRPHAFDAHVRGRYGPPLIPHIFADAFALRVSKS